MPSFKTKRLHPLLKFLIYLQYLEEAEGQNRPYTPLNFPQCFECVNCQNNCKSMIAHLCPICGKPLSFNIAGFGACLNDDCKKVRIFYGIHPPKAAAVKKTKTICITEHGFDFHPPTMFIADTKYFKAERYKKRRLETCSFFKNENGRQVFALLTFEQLLFGTNLDQKREHRTALSLLKKEIQRGATRAGN